MHVCLSVCLSVSVCLPSVCLSVCLYFVCVWLLVYLPALTDLLSEVLICLQPCIVHPEARIVVHTPSRLLGQLQAPFLDRCANLPRLRI